VQRLPSSQLRGPGDLQTPALHTSAPLHALASAQLVPSATGVCVQPAAGSQTSVVQRLRSSQLGAVPGMQTPPWQVSTPLQALLSLHEELSGNTVCWQPAIGSQTSLVQG